MKKITLILVGLTLSLMARNPFPLSEKIIIEKRSISKDVTYQDWCIDATVWRQYDAHYKGSLSQITYFAYNERTVPLRCPDYKRWKINQESLMRAEEVK